MFSFLLFSGANPFILKRTEKAKTVHVKMLLTRKNKQKRPRSKSSSVINNIPELSDEKLNDEKSKVASSPDEKLKPGKPHMKKRFLNESEKLIQDTLLHESKTMVPEKDGFTKLNGVYNDNSMKYNCTGSPHIKKSLNRCFKGNETAQEDLVISTIKRGYMKIMLNNTNAHNVLTISVSNFL